MRDLIKSTYILILSRKPSIPLSYHADPFNLPKDFVIYLKGLVAETITGNEYKELLKENGIEYVGKEETK